MNERRAEHQAHPGGAGRDAGASGGGRWRDSVHALPDRAGHQIALPAAQRSDRQRAPVRRAGFSGQLTEQMRERGSERMTEQVQEALEKQLQLLSERSQGDEIMPDELYQLSQAMVLIAGHLAGL